MFHHGHFIHLLLLRCILEPALSATAAAPPRRIVRRSCLCCLSCTHFLLLSSDKRYTATAPARLLNSHQNLVSWRVRKSHVTACKAVRPTMLGCDREMWSAAHLDTPLRSSFCHRRWHTQNRMLHVMCNYELCLVKVVRDRHIQILIALNRLCHWTLSIQIARRTTRTGMSRCHQLPSPAWGKSNCFCNCFSSHVESKVRGLDLNLTSWAKRVRDGWNTTFLLERSIFRGYVSFREGKKCEKEILADILQNKTFLYFLSMVPTFRLANQPTIARIFWSRRDTDTWDWHLLQPWEEPFFTMINPFGTSWKFQVRQYRNIISYIYITVFNGLDIHLVWWHKNIETFYRHTHTHTHKPVHSYKTADRRSTFWAAVTWCRCNLDI